VNTRGVIAPLGDYAGGGGGPTVRGCTCRRRMAANRVGPYERATRPHGRPTRVGSSTQAAVSGSRALTARNAGRSPIMTPTATLRGFHAPGRGDAHLSALARRVPELPLLARPAQGTERWPTRRSPLPLHRAGSVTDLSLSVIA
jgi:hypothetical protein